MLFIWWEEKDVQKPGDGTTNRMEPEEILGDLDKTKSIIVLEHQPKQLEELEAAGADMQLLRSYA